MAPDTSTATDADAQAALADIERLGGQLRAARESIGKVIYGQQAVIDQTLVTLLSGGHLLHLAVAGCLFNDILREAGQRGITITELQIMADGDFGGDPLLSTGVHYGVTIAGDAPDAELHSLVADCQEASAVAGSLRRGTPVEAGEVHIR